MSRASLIPSVAAALLLGALVLLAAQGLVFALVAVALAVGAVAVATLGTERTGTALIVAGVFTAPMNDVRPIPSADIATFSDVFLLVGFALLLPRLLSQHARPSALHLTGSLAVLVFGMIASLACPDPVTSLVYLARMLTALAFLPLAFVFWRPGRRLVDVLVWAYVAGQLASMLGGFVRGPVDGNRYAGLTTHPNFYGMCAMLAAAFCLHLLHRVPPRHRWLPLLALAGCGLAVLDSGSRAALLATVLVVVVYPVLERSGRAGYLLALGAALAVAFANALLPHVQQGSAIDRLMGTSSSAGSDDQRQNLLVDGIHAFLQHPLVGGGFSAATAETHNAYVEVANAFGIFGLLGYLAILWSLVRPVFRSTGPDGRRRRNRVAYAALGYVFIVLFNNTIWDRFAWVALCLVLVSTGSITDRPTTGREEEDDEVTDPRGAPRRPDVARLRQRVPAAR